jgi:two-component system sensor histidine kinase TctE
LIQQPANDAYDHDVSNSTLSLVRHLQIVDGEARFIFPTEAEQVLRTDSRDQIYYLVLGPGGRFIAGDRDVPIQEVLRRPPRSSEPLMYNATYRGHDVRVSAIQQEIAGQSYLFLTAETTRKRAVLATNSAIATVLSMFVLAAASALMVWNSTSRALAPIEKIRIALHEMAHNNLKPLDESQAPTEIRPLVQEFNSLLQRLDNSVEAQQRFVANAAHQLYTPLAGVRTQLELLRDDVGSAQHSQHITQSIQAIERLSHLVHQMLALLSSVPGGRAQSTKTLVDTAEVIRERSTEWVRLAAPRNVDLGFELETAYVYADPVLVGEMIANLVDNAVRYSPVGAVVTVRCRREVQKVVIEVEDNGPGIPPDELEFVFERFYRLSTSTSVPGSGLGLAIVREVARGLGGEATIYGPRDRQGCLVRVECPLSLADGLPANHEDIPTEKQA